MFSFLPFLQDRLFIFSLVVVIEVFLFFAGLYTKRSYALYRLFFFNIFVIAAIDDRVRGVGFLEGLNSIFPSFIGGVVDSYNGWVVFMHGVVAYPIFFFFAVCLPLICVFWAVALPLVSAVAAGLAGFLIGSAYVGYVCTFLIFLSFVSNAYIFFIFPTLRLAFIRYENHVFETFSEASAALSVQQ